MVTIHLKDGKEKQFESNVALSEAAKAISNSLGKEAVVAKVDGELTDLRDPIVDGTTVEFFTKKDPEGLFTLRHTAAHVMAQAIQHLYPGVKFAIGPAIDDGFYYDIDSEHVFSQEDFDAIERNGKDQQGKYSAGKKGFAESRSIGILQRKESGL